MVVAPKIIYQLTTPARGSGVSCLQYEAVARICQAHEKRLPGGERAGFLLGKINFQLFILTSCR